MSRGESQKPWNYLKVKPEAREAWDEFNQAMDNSTERPNCRGKEDKFIDYPEGSEPSDEQAILMCGKCPFFELCERFADLEEPAVGVWGGKVYGRT